MANVKILYLLGLVGFYLVYCPVYAAEAGDYPAHKSPSQENSIHTEFFPSQILTSPDSFKSAPSVQKLRVRSLIHLDRLLKSLRQHEQLAREKKALGGENAIAKDVETIEVLMVSAKNALIDLEDFTSRTNKRQISQLDIKSRELQIYESVYTEELEPSGTGSLSSTNLR